MTEKKMRKALDKVWIKAYLDYVNNYLTLECMAKDYNMSVNALKAMVDEGRKLHEAQSQ